MTEMIELESYRRHINIKTADDKIHVIPASFIQNVLDGKAELCNLPDWKLIILAIMQDWFNNLKEN